MVSGNTTPPPLPVICAGPYEQDNPDQTALNQNAPSHPEPASLEPTFSAVSETELSSCSAPMAVPVTPRVDPPDAVFVFCHHPSPVEIKLRCLGCPRWPEERQFKRRC
ncbi:hypothetical protein AAFF_G00410850 [Aldrovandia affinis]|uniref:Uncharacterized protein n=1 Tax=Aldrovandia affinis TaxID=143900 RepID=A0AAD7WJR1_9TELE|nr:hypothetical protein AAFF_G00410850 [Aldrovandia affinis]